MYIKLNYGSRNICRISFPIQPQICICIFCTYPRLTFSQFPCRHRGVRRCVIILPVIRPITSCPPFEKLNFHFVQVYVRVSLVDTGSSLHVAEEMSDHVELERLMRNGD